LLPKGHTLRGQDPKCINLCLCLENTDLYTCFTLLAHGNDTRCQEKALYFIALPISFCLLGLIFFFFNIDSSFTLFALCICQSVAEAAEDLWDRYGNDFGTDYSGLFKALSHVHYTVRFAAAEALAAALDESPDSIQVCRFELLTCVYMFLGA
jgi:hypothetical protein